MLGTASRLRTVLDAGSLPILPHTMTTPAPEISPSRCTPSEELANSITHGIGAVLAIGALAVLATLATLRGTAWHVVGCTVYGTTLVLLYLASTIYHSVTLPRTKAIMQALDHIAIYLLIAGTYTPFTLVNLRGPWGWSLLALIWGLALVGIASRLGLITGRKALSVGMYVGMGWVVVIAAKPVIAAIPIGGLLLLLFGGLAYTVGIVFYLWHRLPYNHAIWHGFVLAGSALHFLAVLFYVLPVASAG